MLLLVISAISTQCILLHHGQLFLFPGMLEALNAFQNPSRRRGSNQGMLRYWCLIQLFFNASFIIAVMFRRGGVQRLGIMRKYISWHILAWNSCSTLFGLFLLNELFGRWAALANLVVIVNVLDSTVIKVLLAVYAVISLCNQSPRRNN